MNEKEIKTLYELNPENLYNKKELIFRCDDVSANTNFVKLYQMYDVIEKKFPQARIISCISLFSKRSAAESIYPETPFRSKSLDYFYNVDNFLAREGNTYLKEIASHGLIHLDHADLPYDMQELSIVVSCNFLKTKMFVAPFSTYNQDTIKICVANDIILLDQNEWKAMEFNQLDLSFPRWCFHAWNYTIEEFKEAIEKGN